MPTPSNGRQLLADAAALISSACPSGWDRTVIYVEFRREPEGDLNNASMLECHRGAQRLTDLSLSDGAYAALAALFAQSEGGSEPWSALRLEIDKAGRVSTRYYGDTWPLIEADYARAERRLADAAAP